MIFARRFGFCLLLRRAKIFGTVHKTTHCVVLFTAFESHLYSHEKARKHPQKRMLLAFWRRERDSNPRVLSHKLISRNTRNVTIRPSASLIFEKSADFSAFLLPICQIFRKSDRKVIENRVCSALIYFIYFYSLAQRVSPKYKSCFSPKIP